MILRHTAAFPPTELFRPSTMPCATRKSRRAASQPLTPPIDNLRSTTWPVNACHTTRSSAHTTRMVDSNVLEPASHAADPTRPCPAVTCDELAPRRQQRVNFPKKKAMDQRLNTPNQRTENGEPNGLPVETSQDQLDTCQVCRKAVRGVDRVLKCFSCVC